MFNKALIQLTFFMCFASCTIIIHSEAFITKIINNTQLELNILYPTPTNIITTKDCEHYIAGYMYGLEKKNIHLPPNTFIDLQNAYIPTQNHFNNSITFSLNSPNAIYTRTNFIQLYMLNGDLYKKYPDRTKLGSFADLPIKIFEEKIADKTKYILEIKQILQEAMYSLGSINNYWCNLDAFEIILTKVDTK